MTIETAFTHFPSLATNRLQLRHIQPSYAEALFALYSDEETRQFYGEPHRTIDDTRQAVAHTQARFVQREEIRWGITRTDEDRVIGSCGFHHFDTDFQRAETGYILNRAFWGQGIMVEAMSCILTYGFAALGLHRVEAIIASANERSKSLLLKLGFPYEGNLRQRSSFPRVVQRVDLFTEVAPKPVRCLHLIPGKTPFPHHCHQTSGMNGTASEANSCKIVISLRNPRVQV